MRTQEARHTFFLARSTRYFGLVKAGSSDAQGLRVFCRSRHNANFSWVGIGERGRELFCGKSCRPLSSGGLVRKSPNLGKEHMYVTAVRMQTCCSPAGDQHPGPRDKRPRGESGSRCASPTICRNPAGVPRTDTGKRHRNASQRLPLSLFGLETPARPCTFGRSRPSAAFTVNEGVARLHVRD